MNFPSQIFFNDINHGYRAAILKKNSLWLLPFYMAVATYLYHEKVRTTMRTAIVPATVSYLLKQGYLRTFELEFTSRFVRNYVKKGIGNE